MLVWYVGTKFLTKVKNKINLKNSKVQNVYASNTLRLNLKTLKYSGDSEGETENKTKNK